MESFALLVKQSTRSFKLIVCGSGDSKYVQSMFELARELAVSDLVEFRGWVDSKEKVSVLSESDCFLLTSEDENFAIAVAEGLTNGIPCIVSDKVALAGLVTKYAAGIVFSKLDPEVVSEAMLKITQEDARKMRKASIEAGKELMWDRVVLNWDRSFVMVLENTQ